MTPRVAYGFLDLPQETREKIVRDLGVIGPEETEPEKASERVAFYRAAFNRALKRGRVDELKERINEEVALMEAGRPTDHGIMGG